MKPTLSLLFTLLLFHICQGQFPYDSPCILWDAPVMDSLKIKRLGISKVDIFSYREPLTRGGNPDSEREFHYFNDKGKVEKTVQLLRQDTLSVHTYHYNNNGVLGWKQTKDKKWDRSFREGYRFNAAQHVYQVKAYEMLRNDQRMLIDTRQYVYDHDSLLITIKSLENNRVVALHHFSYNEKNQVTKEAFQDEEGNILQSVEYTYDSEARISKVRMDKGVISEYRYDYNLKGQPMQIEWLEDGKTRGLVMYQYKSNGLVARMDRIQNPDSPSEDHFVKVYNYTSREF